MSRTNNQVIVKIWNQENRITMEIHSFNINTRKDKEIKEFPKTMSSHTMIFEKLCISDIARARQQIMDSKDYKKMREVDYIRKLLIAGGVQELRHMYISNRCMIISLTGVMIVGVAILGNIMGDNDISQRYCPYISLLPNALLIRGCYTRLDNIIKNIVHNSCRRVMVDTYYEKVLLPARRVDMERWQNTLTPDRHHNNGAWLFLVIVLFITGVLLLTAPEAFILNPETSFILSISLMGLGAVRLAMIIRNQCKTTSASLKISDGGEIKQDSRLNADSICCFLNRRRKHPKRESGTLEEPLLNLDIDDLDLNLN
jgi:VIT1/CCC1 family predicted Fe2+/Mn2+ transporter